MAEEKKTTTGEFITSPKVKSWVSVIGLVLLGLGGGAGGMSILETTANAQQWRSQHEKVEFQKKQIITQKLDALERGQASLRCKLVMNGDIISDCICKANGTAINLCSPTGH